MELFWALGLFRLLPEFRRLEAEHQEHLKEELAALLARFRGKGGFLGAYSLVGLSAEADLLLWQGAQDLEALQALRREMHRTRMLGYLEARALFLDRGEGGPSGEALAFFPQGLEVLPPEGTRLLRGKRVALLEGPWARLFPLAVAEGGYLALPRGFREALDDLG
ncbi:Chlorite dismutase [Thermus arciformis]|uniref:Chlorite dismutase n=1 Tax=Thermus arciformis TaxID=482827 RepID=A0A1G7GNZ0_9DEIN|nr:chlorite dismutase family protein [Thermus arciformis]SDE89857.1 Chlorite dismutase [Thermus arciformis]